MRHSRRATADSEILDAPQQPGSAVTWPVRVLGYTVAAWCLGFAAVSGWQLVTGREASDPFATYASGIAAMIILVLVLKILGVVMALLAIRSQLPRMSPKLLAIGLWGAFALLAIDSAGSIVLAVGNMTGPWSQPLLGSRPAVLLLGRSSTCCSSWSAPSCSAFWLGPSTVGTECLGRQPGRVSSVRQYCSVPS